MTKAIAFLVLLLIAPAVYAATYTVGGNRGWTTGVNYGSWASGLNFTIGDTLVFNFDGSHEVTEVNQADYNDCDEDRPINSYRTSPANITLTAAGTRYFICPRADHCEDQGQRLAVTVTAGATAPGGAPGPSTPSPPSGTPATPSAPPPRAGGTVRIVGDNRGWTTGVNYGSWASGQNFTIGDILVFNFDGSHEVTEVNQADYNDCDEDRPINSYRTSPANITLTAAGTRYFICPRADHCEDQGQRLAVTVTAGATGPGGAPGPSTNGATPSPPSGTPGTPSGGATSILSGSSLMVGFSLVLAAVLGLMG